MIKPGTMRNVKRILGVTLAIISAGFIFDLPTIQNLVMDYPLISIGSITASSYFLIKSGART